MDLQAELREAVSFKGRTGRGRFWVVLVLVALLSGFSEQQHGLIGGLLGLAVIWLFLAAVARRAHDRGRSFWTAALAAVPFVIGMGWFLVIPGLFGLLAAGPFLGLFTAGLGWLVFAAWWVLGGIWLLWELGIQAGEPGANAYGQPVRDILDPAG
jgi:uncharacterized membrane protein YhaH (DUF805 family)